MFDPVSWAFGYALTTGLRTIGGLLSRKKDLRSQILDAARSWAGKLGPEKGLVAEALFPKIEDDSELAERPALKALRGRLRANLVPTLIEWHQALIEQWQNVRKTLGSDVQAFFALPESEARAELRDLAVSIITICEQDESLFRSTVLDYLSELAEKVGDSSLPDPFPWAEGSTVRDVALAVEHELGTTVPLITLDDDSAALYIWSKIPGSTAVETKRTLIVIACILCGVPSVETIEIGISDTRDLEGSDGTGPIGMSKLVLSTRDVHLVAVTKKVPLDFWRNIRAFVLINDNTPAQNWQEVPFRRFEEEM